MSLNIALLHNHFDKEHLETVKKEMKELGPPKIHSVWLECYGMWAAIEGSHRLRAAKDLGLRPEIIEVEYSDYETLADYNCDDSGDKCLISLVCDEAYNATIIKF
jgi:hypothetical protein